MLGLKSPDPAGAHTAIPQPVPARENKASCKRFSPGSRKAALQQARFAPSRLHLRRDPSAAILQDCPCCGFFTIQCQVLGNQPFQQPGKERCHSPTSTLRISLACLLESPSALSTPKKFSKQKFFNHVGLLLSQILKGSSLELPAKGTFTIQCH